jgi:hypothetical protein
MALINYAEGIEPIIKSIQGGTFQSGAFGFSMKQKSKQRQPSSGWQKFSSAILTYCTQGWRSLSSAEKANWQNWVEFCPQAQLRNPAKSLTAYHNFVKRNFYYILKNFPDLSFMLVPELIEYGPESITIIPECSLGLLQLSLSFSINDGNQDVILFISPVQSSGKSWVTNATRLMYCVPNSNQIMDISSMYFAKFGRLPVIGDSVFCEVIFCGLDNGQFSRPVKSVLPAVVPVPPPFPSGFGKLYNWYSGQVAISSSDDWVVPSLADFATLANFLSGYEIAGSALKEVGFLHWSDPNLATNSSFFSAVGAGVRIASFGFFDLLFYNYFLVSDDFGVNSPCGKTLVSSLESFDDIISGSLPSHILLAKALGSSIRLVKNSTTLSNGQTSFYAGNDGTIYPTICIGNQEWLSTNLKETLLRDLSPIANVTDSSEWGLSTSPAWCFYDNNAALE